MNRMMHRTNSIATFAGATLIIGLAAGAAMRGCNASEPLRITIEKTNGESTPAYLEKASERAILWKYTPEAPTGNTMARADIKSIEFEMPEGWSEAQLAYRSGLYEEAAAAYSAIAEKYKDIMLLERNPASMAKYLEIESHRALGEYGKLAEVLDAETLKTLQVSLDPQFASQLALDEAWAAASAGNWDVVNQLVAEKSLPKDPNSARTPEFKMEIPPRQMVQLAYLRGLSAEAAGDRPTALADFYRSFTLGYGNNHQLSGKAILKALTILSSEPEFEEDEAKVKEAHALALAYKQCFGSGSIPEQFSKFAEPLPSDVGPAAEASPPEAKADPEAKAPEEGEKAAEGDKAAEGEKGEDADAKAEKK